MKHAYQIVSIVNKAISFSTVVPLRETFTTNIFYTSLYNIIYNCFNNKQSDKLFREIYSEKKANRKQHIDKINIYDCNEE